MNEQTAKLLQSIIGGETYHSGGNMWIVAIHRANGEVLHVTDEGVSVYNDQAHCDVGEEIQSINFC